MTRRLRRGLPALLVPLALLASCGDDDKDETSTTQDEDSEATDAPDDEESESSDEESDDTEAPDDEADDDEDSDDDGDAPDASGGGCAVEVTGDVTASWTAADNSSGFGYGPWIAAMSGDETVLSMDLDETFFIMNCTSDDSSNNISFTSTNDDGIPQEPATYTLTAGTGLISGQSEGDAIGVLIGLEGTDTNWGLESNGTLDITRFDDEVIEGTFEVPVKDILSDMAGEPSKGSAVISGRFRFTNPN